MPNERFEVGNLLDLPAAVTAERFGVVFCRNLLIYLDATARRSVAACLQALAKAGDGLLFVGPSESTPSFGHTLKRVDTPIDSCRGTICSVTFGNLDAQLACWPTGVGQYLAQHRRQLSQLGGNCRVAGDQRPSRIVQWASAHMRSELTGQVALNDCQSAVGRGNSFAQ